MEENVFQKLIHTVQKRMKRNSKTDSFMNEYVFNSSDLDELKKNNNEKIKELKKDIKEQEKKKQVLIEEELDESILSDTTSQSEITNQDDVNNEKTSSDSNDTSAHEQEKTSFIHLEEEYQELIMKKWSKIDFNEVDKDIISGKEILNHNYTITFADDATKYISTIRKKYEVVLCYLIGFNNEKKGIYEKTFFSDKIENEWKYLNYYIKLLEKIRNFKSH